MIANGLVEGLIKNKINFFSLQSPQFLYLVQYPKLCIQFVHATIDQSHRHRTLHQVHSVCLWVQTA